jgi:hypothetical protein
MKTQTRIGLAVGLTLALFAGLAPRALVTGLADQEGKVRGGQ